MSDTLPKGWKWVKLGEVVFINSKNLTPNYPYDEIYYLDTGSVAEGRLISSYKKFYLKEAPSRAKRIVNDGDIVYSLVRPIQRHYGIIKNPPDNLIVSTGFAVITADNNKADNRFTYYYLTLDEIVEYLDSIAEGSTTTYPSIVPDDLKNLIFPLPPLPEQKAIAEVLSSLDDKIDLLHRQNKTLEEMAMTIFRKWFIEDAKEDWEEVKLGEYFDLLGGFPFKSKDYSDFGKYKIITIKNVQDGYLDISNSQTIENLPQGIKPYQILEIGDILISLTGNVGRICIVDTNNCLLNQRVAKIVPKNSGWKPFAYFYFKRAEITQLLTNLAKGSAQLNLSPIETLKLTDTFPSSEIIEKFNKIVQPIFEKILTNKQQIRRLEQLRDTLLPKLMSGEVRVKF